MVDGPTRRFHGDPFRPPTPGKVPARPTEPRAVDRGRWLAFCKLAAESTLAVAEPLRDAVGGPRYRLVSGSSRWPTTANVVKADSAGSPIEFETLQQQVALAV